MNACPAALDHRVFLFFPFTVGSSRRRARAVALLRDQLVSAPLSRLAGSQLMPSWIRDNASAAQGPLWKKQCRKVSTDLHPHVRRLAGGDSAPEPEITRSHCFELEADAVNLLTGSRGRRGDGLRFRLSRTSSARLVDGETSSGTQDPLTASIFVEGATVQLWQSGIGFLILELSYVCDGAIDRAGVILELNHAICRVHAPGGRQADRLRDRISWRRKVNRTDYDQQPGPTLDALAMGLLQASIAEAHWTGEEPILRPQWPSDHRLFVYSFVGFDGPISVEDRDGYALRLSHRYTSEYVVQATRSSNLYAPFENVVHAASTEGGAVVVTRAAGVQFLADFLETAVRMVYLPLAIVSLHELRYLLRLSQESVAHSPAGRGFARQVRNLAQLGQEFACFKLYFRFSHASQVGHQNDTYALWREALQSGHLLEEATGDVEQAHLVLSERRWRVYGTAGTLFIAYLALTNLVDRGLDVIFNREDFLALAGIKTAKGLLTIEEFEAVRAHFSELQQIGYGLALVAAIAVAGLVYKLARSTRL